MLGGSLALPQPTGLIEYTAEADYDSIHFIADLTNDYIVLVTCRLHINSSVRTTKYNCCKVFAFSFYQRMLNNPNIYKQSYNR